MNLNGYKVKKISLHKAKNGSGYFAITASNGDGAKINMQCYDDTLAFMGIDASTRKKLSDRIAFYEGGVYDFSCEASWETKVEGSTFKQNLKWAKIQSYKKSNYKFIEAKPEKPEQKKEEKEIKPIKKISGFGEEEA